MKTATLLMLVVLASILVHQQTQSRSVRVVLEQPQTPSIPVVSGKSLCHPDQLRLAQQNEKPKKGDAVLVCPSVRYFGNLRATMSCADEFGCTTILNGPVTIHIQ
jgi:hypothetical protein